MKAWAGSLLRGFLVVEVVGGSMAPTFTDGDRLLAHRRRALRRGRVAVVDWAGQRLVKRIVAAPGDAVPERLLEVVGAQPGDRVADGKLLLLGDHPHSRDSKQLGYCRAQDVVAVMLFPVRRAPMRQQPQEQG